MKDQLIDLLNQTLQTLQKQNLLPKELPVAAAVSSCKNPNHGDYTTNCALLLAKAAKLPPRVLAQRIVDTLPSSSLIQRIDIAGPGFINFSLNEKTMYEIIPQAIDEKENFGRSTLGQGQRVHIEYVSANPTGPLHVGHGRSAAYGDSVANLLMACGFNAHREYYVNDAGRQMRILALSVWLRYLQLHEEQVELPKKAYQGSYVTDIAKQLVKQYHSRFHHTQESLNLLTETIEDEEKYLDNLVHNACQILGEENFKIIFQAALNAIEEDIRDDLAEFNVTYDEWFHESHLFKEGLIEASIKLLDDHGHVYEKEGAKWFRSTEFGDKKDRVLIRSNGITTYFASDVAYHLYKYRQGYQQIIDVFGADHHGYLSRIRGFLQGLGENPDKVRTLLVQFAILYRGLEKVSMSTRSGQFVTLRQLRKEVGNDAARFFYVMRKPEQHLDFDLDLAKSHSNENPVYYIQYAHARISSVWQTLEASDQSWDKSLGFEYLSLLCTPHEKYLINALIRYPDIIKTSARKYEPHTLAHFLLDLATNFHAYYNAEKFLVEQTPLRNARLCLIAAVQQVFANGLPLLGITAPTKM